MVSHTLPPATLVLLETRTTCKSLFPAPPCPFLQVEPGELTTVLDSDLEVPTSNGPSGDFEIQEEEETTRPELSNEVVAVVTPPAAPGLGKNAEPGLIDNTIESGSSAAQLPQKNILERKEVLIGERGAHGLVGGWRAWPSARCWGGAGAHNLTRPNRWVLSILHSNQHTVAAP